MLSGVHYCLGLCACAVMKMSKPKLEKKHTEIRKLLVQVYDENVMKQKKYCRKGSNFSEEREQMIDE